MANVVADALSRKSYTKEVQVAAMSSELCTEFEQLNLGVGVWPPISTRQDMGCTIKGGPAHKIKACTALVDVHRKILYSTK